MPALETTPSPSHQHTVPVLASAPTLTRRRRWRRVLLTLVGVAVALTLLLLSRLRVLHTPSGVHAGVLLALAGDAGIRIPAYAGTGDRVRIADMLAGPVIRRGIDGQWSAEWFCEDSTHRATGSDSTLTVTCADRTLRVSTTVAAVAPAVAPMPDSVLVLSDIEGNSAFLDAALREAGVMAADGSWRFGRGHLVMLGDNVDRGRDVFAVLWRLHDLTRQAHAAGGAVHVVLGNHEQYLLRGNVSRANVEHLYATQQLGGQSRSVESGTVLGDWLRALPVIVRLGDVIFVHGGVSIASAQSAIDPARLNAVMRSYWADSTASPKHTSDRDAVLGFSGVTQYRGYLQASAEHYPLATGADLDGVLKLLGAQTIVVAHTPVDSVHALRGGRVWAVDVNEPGAHSQLLRFDQGVPRAVTLTVQRASERAAPTLRVRTLNLFAKEDRAMVSAMRAKVRQLQELPHPY